MNPPLYQSPSLPQKKVRITTQSQLFSLTIPEATEFDELNQNPIDGQLISATSIEQCAFPELKSELEKGVALYEGGTPPEADSSLFKHLDRWKKDQVLVNSKNSNEIRVLRDKHKNSLQQGDDFPKVNLDILDSILRIPQDDGSIHGNSNNHSSKAVTDKGNKKLKNLNGEEIHSNNSITQINTSLRTINLLKKQKSIAFNPLIKDLSDQNDKGKKADTTSLFKDSITSESRQRLVNKKLVNNLIFDRITKTYGSGILEAHSDRSQFNNQSAQKAETLFQDEIHRFSQHTLASFKQLLHTFEKSKHIIDYEGIRQKLMVYIRQTPSILINENENENQSNGQYMAQKRGKEQRYHFKMTEQALLNNYKSISKEIEMKYLRIQEVRGAAHDLRSQINDLKKEQIELDERAQKEMTEKKYNFNRASLLSKSQILIQQAQENQKQEESVIKLSIEAQQKAIHDAFEQSKVKIQKEVEKQGSCIDDDQKDVKMLKQKREITRSLLKELYYEYMKDQDNTKGQSLIWIAKAMLEVEIDLVTSESFPPFLDTSSIQFLSEYATLDNTLDKLQDQMKKNAIENNKVTKGKQDDFEKNYLDSQNSQRILDVKTKIKRIAMSDMLKVRRPVFIASQGKSPELTFEEIQEPKEAENITFSLSKAPAQKLNQIRQNQTAREEIDAIQARQKAIKEKEVHRLFEKWLSMKNESKNESDLKAVLIALVGQIEAEENIKVYRQTFAGKQANAEKNKTFTFSRSSLLKNHIHRDDNFEKTKNKSAFFSSQQNSTISLDQNGQSNQQTTTESSQGTYYLKQSIYPQRNLNQQCFSIPAPMVRRIKEIKQNSYHTDRESNLNYQSNKQLINSSSSLQQYQKNSISHNDNNNNRYLSQRYRQSYSHFPEFSTFNLTTHEISPPQSERSSYQMNFKSPRHDLFQSRLQ